MKPNNVAILEGEERIDPLRTFIGEVRSGWWIIVIGGLLGAIAGCVVNVASTPVYESCATMYVTSGSDADSQSAYQGSLASQQRVASYARLVTSDAVIDDALRRSGLNLESSEAKAALVSSATPQTVLLTLCAQEHDAVVASTLVNSVAESMVAYVTTLETPSAGGQPLAKMTVVTPGTTSDVPVSPRVGQNVLIGLIVGLVLAGMFVFGRSRLGTRIRDEGDLDDAIGVHSLGVVASDGAFADRSLIDFRAGGSSTAEQFRKIRTNLTFANVDNSVRKILISSPSQSEGKTTTSLNLAASLAELGKSVVLVDADLRRPAVASRLQAVSPDIGLTDYLRGSAPVGDVLQRSGVGGFDVLAAGALPPNPAELLGSRRTGQLLDELCELYDYVLVDSPPVLPVTDAVVVSQWVDGGIIVVRAGGTTRQELVASLAQLHASRVSILGVVLNGVNLKARDNRYGYYAQASREGVTA